MFYLLIILIIFSAVFAVLNDFSNSGILFIKRILTGTVLSGLFLLGIKFLSFGYFLSVLGGILIMYAGFMYLGIFNTTVNDYLNPFSVHFLFILIASFKSHLTLNLFIITIFIFIVIYVLFLIVFQKIINSKITGRPFYKDFSELTGIINGIFLYITGFIIAIDRIEFLEKIADKIF